MAYQGKPQSDGEYGDGSDGDLVYGFHGVTFLSRTMYPNSVTVGNSAVIITAGYQFYIKNYLNLSTSGVVQNNGSNATGFSGARGYTAAIYNHSNGANGSSGIGFAAGAVTNSLGGSGGGGGAGSGNAGGAGGTASVPASASGGLINLKYIPHSVSKIGVGSVINVYSAGCGGGGGGGDGTNPGGGGGAGGGVLMINARKVFGTGTLSAIGGNGANATAGNTGGGGSGGGGGIIIFSETKQSEFLGTLSYSPGLPGTPFGTGATGSVGATGNIFWNDNTS